MAWGKVAYIGLRVVLGFVSGGTSEAAFLAGKSKLHVIRLFAVVAPCL